MTSVHSTWRSACGRYTVTLTEPCVGRMLELARQSFPREVGAALMGSYSDDGFVATVSGVAPVASDSRSSRFTFRRGIRGLVKFLRDVFQSSGGLVHYVGEWHSHPGGAPIPSGTDDRNQFGIARDTAAMCPECILVIVGVAGRQDRDGDVGVYVYSAKSGRIDLARDGENNAS